MQATIRPRIHNFPSKIEGFKMSQMRAAKGHCGAAARCPAHAGGAAALYLRATAMAANRRLHPRFADAGRRL
jgi:hypothetical protein